MLRAKIDGAKVKLPELISLVESGEPVKIANGGAPVVGLASVASRGAQKTLNVTRALKAMHKTDPIDQQQFIEMRHRGRRS